MPRPNAPATEQEEALRAWREMPLVRLNERLLAVTVGEDVARDTLDWAFEAGWEARGKRE
jgi:hypothetical protein